MWICKCVLFLISCSVYVNNMIDVNNDRFIIRRNELFRLDIYNTFCVCVCVYRITY